MDNYKTFFNWSTGKDSALALFKLMQSDKYKVEHLITTVNSHYNRVSMHGLKRELMEEQIKALQLPFSTIELPENPSMEEYESIMKQEILKLVNKGFQFSAFGDIFLEDLKSFRDQQLQNVGLKGIYPLWKQNTKDLIHEFIDLGFKAITVCTNHNLLGDDFIGRIIDKNFIKDLPKNVDPCGENGEFHTFCFEGPIFHSKINFELENRIERTYPNPENKETQVTFTFQELNTPH